MFILCSYMSLLHCVFKNSKTKPFSKLRCPFWVYAYNSMQHMLDILKHNYTWYNPFPRVLSLLLFRGWLCDILRQCRARIRRRYRVKCVSLEQIPAERNAAIRERNIFWALFPNPSYIEPLCIPLNGANNLTRKLDVVAGLTKEGPRWGRQLAEL